MGFDIKKRKNCITPFSVTKHEEKIVYFCSVNEENHTVVTICSRRGKNLKKIKEVAIFNEKGRRENFNNCDSFRIFNSGHKWYLMYSHAYSRFFIKKRQLIIAVSADMLRFDIIDREDDNKKNDLLAAISTHRHKKYFLAYSGNDSISAAASLDLKKWHYSGKVLCPRKDSFDKDPLHAIEAIKTNRGILVLYVSQSKRNKKLKKVVIGGALFSVDQPYKILWRSSGAIFEKTFRDEKKWPKYLGTIVDGVKMETYWLLGKGKIVTLKEKISIPFKSTLVKKRPVQLSRHYDNPIIKPKNENNWECGATFNSAAICLGDKIHLIYRAVGDNGVSVFGYAASKDGLKIDERLNNPVFAAKNFDQYKKEDQALFPSKYVSGGSWIGCEDPRIMQIDDRIYMVYVSFDGYTAPGVSLTWISVEDFLQKKWTWKRPILISKKGEIQKNWVLFPEKINGKYAILHSITPRISIEYIADLNADFVIDSMKKPGKDENRWDNIVRGVGSPPIKTELGWLVLYHAMDKNDPNRYKVGAMILDCNDPTKILYRATCPILEPDEKYENEGAKAGVVYVCGAVVKGETLFVYYGGADSVVCVAMANIADFLKDMACETAKKNIDQKRN